MERLEELTLLIILYGLFLGLPVFLTVVNIIRLFSEKKFNKSIFDIATVFFGSVYSLMYMAAFVGDKEYYEPVILGGGDPAYHTPVSGDFSLSFSVFAFVGIISLILLSMIKKQKPPPVQYEGHYLCTVAAGGHEKIVKPQRMGVRLGEKIVVNRQLCVANAFEDLIHERFPKFHKVVRNFYDSYGYPLSKIITTKTRADIVYILMKPLEWTFLLVLYIFDSRPENRIAVQYTGKNKKDFENN